MDIKNIKKEWNAKILDILKAFIHICDTHHLRYYCCAGTAIGAVRHHGMIPWDDDIDVIMPRPDYDRLIEIAQKEDFGKYEVVTPYNNERYPLYFSKLVDKSTTLIEEKERPCVIGLFIDIFPLDATDDDEEKAKALQRKYVKVINRLNAISTRNSFGEYLALLSDKKTWGRFAIKTAGFFFRPILRRRLIQQMDELSHLYDFDKAKTYRYIQVLIITRRYSLRNGSAKARSSLSRTPPCSCLSKQTPISATSSATTCNTLLWNREWRNICAITSIWRRGKLGTRSRRN